MADLTAAECQCRFPHRRERGRAVLVLVLRVEVPFSPPVNALIDSERLTEDEALEWE